MKTINTINKSMAKLEHISQLNWSKRDLNMNHVATGNTVFKSVVQQTNDPKTYSEI
jgi:hypothetical protein